MDLNCNDECVMRNNLSRRRAKAPGALTGGQQVPQCPAFVGRGVRVRAAVQHPRPGIGSPPCLPPLRCCVVLAVARQRRQRQHHVSCKRQGPARGSRGQRQGRWVTGRWVTNKAEHKARCPKQALAAPAPAPALPLHPATLPTRTCHVGELVPAAQEPTPPGEPLPPRQAGNAVPGSHGAAPAGGCRQLNSGSAPQAGSCSAGDNNVRPAAGPATLGSTLSHCSTWLCCAATSCVTAAVCRCCCTLATTPSCCRYSACASALRRSAAARRRRQGPPGCSAPPAAVPAGGRRPAAAACRASAAKPAQPGTTTSAGGRRLPSAPAHAPHGFGWALRVSAGAAVRGRGSSGGGRWASGWAGRVGVHDAAMQRGGIRRLHNAYPPAAPKTISVFLDEWRSAFFQPRQLRGTE